MYKTKPLYVVLGRLENVKKISSGWSALCPTHDDHNPSLRISTGDDGRILLKCFSGCQVEDIVSAIGLEMKDLFPQNGNERGKSEILKTYDYRDENGNLKYQVVRMKSKGFKQRQPNDNGGWIWNLKGIKYLIYRLPETLEAIRNNHYVFIVEGEKDVDNLVSIGLYATCNSGGAGKWKPHHNEYFKNARVVILPHNDSAGKSHALQVAENLHGVAQEIRIVELPDLPHKGDVSDWLANGGTKDELIRLVNTIPLWNPSAKSEYNTHEYAFHLTDTGNAERLVSLFGDQIRHNEYPFKKWFVWDGIRWKIDTSNRIYDFADKTVRKMYEEAAKIDNSDEREQLVKWAASSETARKKKDMVFIASSNQSITLEPNELDCNPWLFNTENCTRDLSNGEVIKKEHKPEDIITKVSPVIFDPHAKCPRWEKFLQDIFPNKEEMIVFVRRAVGYTLTGITSEQCLFFCYGTGANGKTVFLETLKLLFGDYAGKVPSEMIMSQRYSGIPSDVASMHSKRLVICSEMEENRMFAESKVNDLTGGDTVVARKLYEDWFEFKPTFKLWIYGNHKPRIKGEDDEIWRRIKIIPFTFTIPLDNRIPIHHLLNTFKSELSGILNWALQGYIEFIERGLSEPDEVSNAVSEYRSEMDIIGQFIEECCEQKQESNIAAKTLWEVYKKWAENNGESFVKL